MLSKFILIGHESKEIVKEIINKKNRHFRILFHFVFPIPSLAWSTKASTTHVKTHEQARVSN